MGKANDIIRGVIDTHIVSNKTIREIERMDYAILKAGGSINAGIDQKEGIAAMCVWKQIRGFRYTEKGTQLTIAQLNEIADDTRIRFLQQHIINYATYNILLDFYDWLCQKRLLTKPAEGFWRKINRTMDDYQKAHASGLDRKTWVLFLDHMRLSFDMIQEEVGKLETTIRDYLIQHRSEVVESGQKDDIAILQKAAVCFIFLTATQHSYRDFFRDIINTHGVDFSSEFRYADLSKMTRNAVWMCEKLGIKFCIDNDGDTVLIGVNINNSIRVNSQWNTIVDILGNTELLDETALHAINLNPETKKEYEEEVAKKNAEEQAKMDAEEQKNYEAGLEELSRKFNVKRIAS